MGIKSSGESRWGLRSVVWSVLCAVLMACGPGGPGGNGPGGDAECLVQADCKADNEAEYKKACVAWTCTDTLPENKVHKVRLVLDSREASRSRSFRIWAIHPRKPDGGTVTCDELDSLEGSATGALLSGETYNITSMPSQQTRDCNPCNRPNIVTEMQVQVDSPDRLIYVAGYPNEIRASGSEGEQMVGKCALVALDKDYTRVDL